MFRSGLFYKSKYKKINKKKDSWAIPSVEGRDFSRKEVRKRVRSLKLQLFCTLVGLVASGMFSLLGDWCTLPGGTGEEVLPRSA